MPSRHPPRAADEIGLAPERPGFATEHGDIALIHPPARPEEFRPEELPGAVHDWAALAAAGRIGANPPAPPAVAARRARTEALFRRIGEARRRLW